MARPLQLSSDLTTRTVWFDGVTSYGPSLLEEGLYRAHASGRSEVYVTKITSEIAQYNRIAKTPFVQRDAASVVLPANMHDWVTPNSDLDVRSSVVDCLAAFLPTVPEEMHAQYISRVEHELDLYEQHNLLHVLRACFHVVNTLQESGVVWGVGRGSSVSSFVLFLIGIHDIDSVKYDLEPDDFITST